LENYFMNRALKKPRGNIPEHVKRAVNARDGQKCRYCHDVTEYIQHDHIIPVYLNGPTTLENIQSLCPKCNASKGNKITCKNNACGHWNSPDLAKCSRCETPLVYTNYSETFAGRLEKVFLRVGRASVIAGVAAILLILMVGGLYVSRYFSRSSDSTSDQATSVDTIINDVISVSPQQPASLKIVIPSGAKNARVVGGFKVTSGANVNFFILNDAQFAQFSNDINTPALTKREQAASAKVRQPLQSGTYYLVFAGISNSKVAAEFYSKYD
ncbi:MAG: HNH endonuclease, partial [Pyrinomonadaceae bacterium]